MTSQGGEEETAPPTPNETAAAKVEVAEADEEYDEFNTEEDDSGGFILAPVGEHHMTRALSGFDPNLAADAAAVARRMTMTASLSAAQVMLALELQNEEEEEGAGGKKKKQQRAMKFFRKILRRPTVLLSSLIKPESKGIEFIDYRFYPMRSYVELPEPLIKGLEKLKKDYYLIIGRPTMAPGAGLKGYKDVTTKKERKLAPCIGVFDHPGMLKDFKDDKFQWIEFPVGDTFMLDVSGMKTKDDYKKVLTKAGKKNYTAKFKKFEKEPNLVYELVDWVGTDENIDRIWPLYEATGEKNGFTVLTKEDFYRYHRIVPNQKVAYIWDISDPNNKKLTSFNTAFIWKDILHPMWCGTDYNNPLNRTCSTYFIILYNMAHYAIEQPNLNWVDLGATQRKAKTSIGYKPHPCSLYFRCYNTAYKKIVEYSMEKYYDPSKCMTDP